MALETPQDTWQAVTSGSLTLLDIRPPQAYTQGHVPGSVSAPFSRAGWGRAVATFLKSQGGNLGLFADSDILARTAKDTLASENVPVLALYTGGPGGWKAAGLPLVSVENLTVDELHDKLREWTVIDVREPYEWRSGVVPGALRVPLGTLPDKLQELDPEATYALICASGNRSQQAAAFLADRGFRAANVVGGMSLWLGAGHPIERVLS